MRRILLAAAIFSLAPGRAHAGPAAPFVFSPWDLTQDNVGTNGNGNIIYIVFTDATVLDTTQPSTIFGDAAAPAVLTDTPAQIPEPRPFLPIGLALALILWRSSRAGPRSPSA